MRKIRFRGKVLQSSSYPEMVGEWVYGYYIEDLHEGKLRGFIFNCPIYFMVDPRTVGQDTGLRDKNEHRIYDGDTLKGVSANEFSKGEINNYEVMWGVDHWHIKSTYFSLQELFNYCNNDITVIGNIFDNPKLIEK